MFTFNKYINHIKLSVCLFILIGCFSLNSFGQELEWIFNVSSQMDQNVAIDIIPNSQITSLITNNNGEIYAVASHHGYHNLGGLVYGTSSSTTDSLIIKLDENGNVIWAKQLKGGLYSFNSIVLDANENILISGNVSPYITSLYFDPNPPNPNFPNIITPTYENLISDLNYGFVSKMDSQGNYIDSIIFEDIGFSDIVVDNDNNIVVVGSTTTNEQQYAYIGRFNSNLNLLWEKIFSSQNGSSYFSAVACDSQNNIYCQGAYNNSFSFGNSNLQNSEVEYDSEFIGKMLSDNNESWIIELYDKRQSYQQRDIELDSSDNLCFYLTYEENFSVQFNNLILSNLPVQDENELIVFKIDVNGNHIWNVPMYGIANQKIEGFNVNFLDEVIIVMGSDDYDILNYSNIINIETEGQPSLLLKANTSGDLIDFKRLDIAHPLDVTSDSNNNILLGGYINRPTDFDPHPFSEYAVSPNEYTINGNSYYEQMGFVLKFSPCDVVPLFEDTYDFCLASYPSTPTVGDIKPSALNVRWYNSEGSQTALPDDFVLTDGQVYYYDNIVESCPSFDRLPVTMVFLPPSSPPSIDAVQPCYFETMRLSDLNISGEDLQFYASLDTSEPIDASTLIVSGTTYYVSQAIVCESERVPITVTDYFGDSPIKYTAYFCTDEEGIAQFANLTDYNYVFIPENAQEGNYAFSFYETYEDASEEQNPIANFQNYPVSGQTVYVRVLLAQVGCYRIAELSLQFSFPLEIEDILTKDWANAHNSITVFPNEEGYTYSLDGVTYQEDNYFGDLPSGEYTVYLRNAEGCDSEPKTVYLLDYPRFFTPNGDGVNDYWRVDFSQFQEVFDVEIYDRYGKLLATFDKDYQGWDGKFNRISLPSTDYWFKIIRVSDRKVVYLGHFSLLL